MKISKIFYSLQGEGCWTGIPVLFIQFHRDTKGGEEVSIEDIVHRCKRHYHVVLTGDEPTDQEDFVPLVTALIGSHHVVHVETNGLNHKKLQQVRGYSVWITISPKFQNLPDIETLTSADEVKWIIDAPEDIIEVAKVVAALARISGYIPLFLLQPLSMDPDATELCVQEVLNFPKYYRLSIQLHKYLGVK